MSFTWVLVRIVAVVVTVVGMIAPLVFPEMGNLVGAVLPGLFWFFASFAGDGDRRRDVILIAVISCLWTWTIWFAMSWSGFWKVMAKAPDGGSGLAFAVCIPLSMFLVTKVQSRKWNSI